MSHCKSRGQKLNHFLWTCVSVTKRQRFLCMLFYCFHTCCNPSDTSGSSHKWRFIFWVNVSGSQFLSLLWDALTGILRMCFYLVLLFLSVVFFLPSSAASSPADWSLWVPLPPAVIMIFKAVLVPVHENKCSASDVSNNVRCQARYLWEDVQRNREFWAVFQVASVLVD